MSIAWYLLVKVKKGNQQTLLKVHTSHINIWNTANTTSLVNFTFVSIILLFFYHYSVMAKRSMNQRKTHTLPDLRKPMHP